MGLSPLIRKLTAVVTYQRRCFPWPGMSLPGPWDEKKKVMKCLPNMVKFITMGFNSDELLSHVRLCNSMDCSMPGLPVHHQLQKFTQTHVHWVGDAIQPSHPLSSPSPPDFNFAWHQGLFQWVSSLHHMIGVGVSAPASVLPMKWFPLRWTGWIPLQFKGLLRVFYI